jgi:hypothetical protein
MKRSLYDSEYERVRREAGLDRPEFAEPEESPPVDIARIEAAHDDFKGRMAAFDVHETQRRAEAKAEADRYTREINERGRLAEFAHAGVAPPVGVQASLELLLWIGWTIEEADGQKVLIRPKQVPRKTREEYMAESLKESL